MKLLEIYNKKRKMKSLAMWNDYRAQLVQNKKLAENKIIILVELTSEFDRGECKTSTVGKRGFH